MIGGGEGGTRWFGGLSRMMVAPLVSASGRQRLRGVMALTRQKDLRTLAGLVEEGRLTPAVDRIFPLGEAAEAVAYMRSGQVRGKAVIGLA